MVANLCQGINQFSSFLALIEYIWRKYSAIKGTMQMIGTIFLMLNFLLSIIITKISPKHYFEDSL